MPITKNFDIELKDLDDNVIPRNPRKPELGNMTMRHYVMDALSIIDQDDKSTGEERATRFILIMKLKKGGDVELSPEEVVEIKKYVGKLCPPLIVGPIFEHLK